jgi:two-component system phosphate regulon sensor histidine kinase PhoR
MKNLYLAEMGRELHARALLLRNQLSSSHILSNAARVDSLCKKLGRESSTRFTIALPSGEVIGDSDNDPAKMENHANRPEIREALAGSIGVSTRYSHTLFETMMYSAEPILEDGRIIGVVRAALPVTFIDHAFGSIYPKIVIGGVVIALLTGLLSLHMAHRMSNPLERMRRLSERFSRGELHHRLPRGKSREIDELALAMNEMAAQLDEKIRTVVDQRNELEAVLTSMVEGVLAFDINERLVSLNQAASRMLDLDWDRMKGHYVQEAIRHVQLQKFVARILEGNEPIENEIEIQGDDSRVLQMHGTILRDDKGQRLGALIVLNDITHLRRLENIRRDFVANVSHELRTPITSIKGFVETLQEGALNDPADARRFLGIIAQQTDRLNSIIKDLLTLSEIEQTEEARISLQHTAIQNVLSNAISLCETEAKAKGIVIGLECDKTISADINLPLIEQAVVNVLDNAIKYSERGGRVQVSAAQTETEIVLSIQDWGCGIEKKHLPRLFERFYRVDKARSREQGGTGLGLAIVKHIAAAHHGSVDVKSVPGKGSTFSIHLPKNP